MTRARPSALLLSAVTLGMTGAILGLGAVAAVAQDLPYERAALTIVVPDVTFEDMMGLPAAADLARAGGAGLLANADEFQLPAAPATPGVPEGTPPGREEFLVLDRGSPTLDEEIRDAVGSFPADELLVLLLSQDADGIAPDGDELMPIVMAVGAPDTLFPDDGSQGSLTSDSTRRAGVVSGADVRATDVAFLGGPTEDFAGSPIEIIEGPPPFELHDRYLAQRRMYVPVGGAAAIYLAISGIGGIVVLALGTRAPRRVRRAFGWACLSVAGLAVGLLAAGHLPELTYATVVPFVAIVTVFGTLAFAPLEHRDLLLVPVGIGIAVLVAFAAEAALGWTAMLTPFVGGSQLDGGRFYGLPNVGIGILVGASLWVAHRLRTSAGFALLVGTALFAGLPYLGSNLGGAATLFAGAGLWLAVRERDRLGTLKGVGVAAATMLVGTALVLGLHAISPVETHVSRFEEQVDGPGGVIDKIVDRLQVGFDLIASNPLALIPVLGMPLAIWAVLRPPAALRPSLDRSPAWRDAILVTFACGVVAYLVNDTGPAAAGFAFGLGLGGLLGVSLLSGDGKMGEP